MFNGIIFKTGIVKNIKRKKIVFMLVFKQHLNLQKSDLGSSICCDGVCLTLDKVDNNKLFLYF